MDTKYVITEGTLTEIADAIRTQENSSETIPTKEFARHISAIEPKVGEYMRITDYLDYPTPLDETNYTEEQVARCTELYNFYLEMEDIT